MERKLNYIYFIAIVFIVFEGKQKEVISFLHTK